MKKIIVLIALVLALTACTAPAESTMSTEPVDMTVAVLQPSTESPTVPAVETEAPTEAPTEQPTEAPVIPADITFSYEYIYKDDVMPYGLFTPSIAEEAEALPVIVFLHGAGETNCTTDWFASVGLPKTLIDWPMDGFGAYVICPHLRDKWNLEVWNNPHVAKNLIALIEDFASDHNVDRDNIIISGFSLGGPGAMYMASEYPDYFSKLVVMSSLHLPNGDITKIQIPVLGCVEYFQNSFHFMNSGFPAFFGEENVWKYDSEHGLLPFAAFTEDKDGDNYSDLVAWMLETSPADNTGGTE